MGTTTPPTGQQITMVWARIDAMALCLVDAFDAYTMINNYAAFRDAMERAVKEHGATNVVTAHTINDTTGTYDIQLIWVGDEPDEMWVFDAWDEDTIAENHEGFQTKLTEASAYKHHAAQKIAVDLDALARLFDGGSRV